ncbi:MAG: CpaF family protein [Pirellulaceae bacterium]|nr:CpaF family protein [Pirellulaceae bacterium]
MDLLIDRQSKGGNRLHREWLTLVLSVHTKLVQSLEWAGARISKEQMDRQLPALVHQICNLEAKHLSDDEKEELVRSVMSETIGLGPLDSLLSDPLVSDVLVNSSDEVFIERRGRLIRTPICFANDDHLLRIIQRIAGRVGRRIDESSPMVDARLEDGSRVNAVVRPLALHGPTLSIRRFGTNPIGIDDLVGHGSISEEMVDFLRQAVVARISFLISGGTGAGKTTLLNAVSSFIPRSERIVTIEDAAELKLQHPHVISLETRPANTEGSGTVSIRDLVRTSLRMRPDRILVGEVRGDEVIDMLQAMNTGHPGSLSTIHANGTKDALARLEIMVGMSGQELPLPVLRNYVTAGIRLLVHVERLHGGVRRVMQISEVVGMKNGEYRLREIFGFREDGINDDGESYGEFYATGYLPRFMKRKTEVGRKGKSNQKSIVLPTPILSSPIPESPSIDSAVVASQSSVKRPRFTIVSAVVEKTENSLEEQSNPTTIDETAPSSRSEDAEFSESSNLSDATSDSLKPTLDVPSSRNEASTHASTALEKYLKLMESSSTESIIIGIADANTEWSMPIVSPAVEPDTMSSSRSQVDSIIGSLRFGQMDEAIDSMAMSQATSRNKL